jgi:hypothetical protein
LKEDLKKELKEELLSSNLFNEEDLTNPTEKDTTLDKDPSTAAGYVNKEQTPNTKYTKNPITKDSLTDPNDLPTNSKYQIY